VDGDFDSYFKWLGIPPDEQPPNHYRLLGIPELTSDLDVIENCAEQRIRHVRSFQIGDRAEHAHQLLNEIAAAKACLLNVDSKAVYDSQLRVEYEPTIMPADFVKLEVVDEVPPAPTNSSVTPIVSALQTASVARPVINATSTESPKTNWSTAIAIAVLGVVLVPMALSKLSPREGEVEMTASRSGPESQESESVDNAQDLDDASNSAMQEFEIRVDDMDLPSSEEPSIDLLSLIDIDLHKLSGIWELDSKGILGTGTLTPRRVAVLEVPLSPSRKFSIEFDVKRMSERQNGFHAHIPVSTGGFRFFVDQTSDGVPFTGIAAGERNLALVKGSALNQGQLSTIRCDVRDKEIVVLINGKVHVSWSGDPTQLKNNRLSPPAEGVSIGTPSSIHVAASHGASFLISRIELFPSTDPKVDSTTPPLRRVNVESMPSIAKVDAANDPARAESEINTDRSLFNFFSVLAYGPNANKKRC